MTKQYVIERGSSLPLCCVDNDVYFDYMHGQVIDNENALNFIEDGLERKSMKVENIDLVIYEIFYSETIEERRCGGAGWYPVCSIEERTVAYNYVINSCSNYLDENKQLLTNEKRQYIIDKLMKGEYEQVKIWE